MFQIIAYAIVILKNILYDLESLFFKKMQKEELMKYTINTNIDSFKIVINKFIITRYRLQSIYYAYYVKKK
jgi:hypothetical protein